MKFFMLVWMLVAACKGDDKSAPHAKDVTQPSKSAGASQQGATAQEPVGREYLMHETTPDRYAHAIGLSAGFFAWTELIEKRENANGLKDSFYEIFAVALNEDWKPASLGKFLQENQMLVGPRLVRTDNDNKLWIAELPDGPFVETDVSVDVRPFSTAIVGSAYMAILGDNDMSVYKSVLRVSVKDGTATVTDMPKPPKDHAVHRIVAVEGDHLLVRASHFDKLSEGILFLLNHQRWHLFQSWA